MTTTVTVKTHSWPVEVTITDDYELHGATRVYHAETSTLPPDSVRDFHLTSTRSMSFRELPIPHTSAAPETIEGAASEIEHHRV